VRAQDPHTAQDNEASAQLSWPGGEQRKISVSWLGGDQSNTGLDFHSMAACSLRVLLPVVHR